MRGPPTISTLFPYTTLFRSQVLEKARNLAVVVFRNEELVRQAIVLECLDIDKHVAAEDIALEIDRKSTRLNSSHPSISYAVFCLKKKITAHAPVRQVAV